MICRGDFVLDWMGRAGIALAPGDPPPELDLDDYLKRALLHYRKTPKWWTVSLFSGGVVWSPEPLTDSWGPASMALLRMAVRRSDESVKEQLASMVSPEANGQSLSCLC